MSHTAEQCYQDIKADVFSQVKGMEPGTYVGPGTMMKILKIENMYLVKLTLTYRSWTFFFQAADYEREVAA